MKVSVFGDFMLDVNEDDKRAWLGGAGTVVRAIQEFGASAVGHGYLDERTRSGIVGIGVADESTRNVWAVGDGELRLRTHRFNRSGGVVTQREDFVFGSGRLRAQEELIRFLPMVERLVISDFSKGTDELMAGLVDRDRKCLIVASKKGVAQNLPHAILVTSAEDRGLVSADSQACMNWAKSASKFRRGDVILTLDRFGALLLSEGTPFYVPSPVVSGPCWTIGAGDWFVGSLTSALIDQVPLEIALRRAVLDATETVRYPGVGGK